MPFVLDEATKQFLEDSGQDPEEYTRRMQYLQAVEEARPSSIMESPDPWAGPTELRLSDYYGATPPQIGNLSQGLSEFATGITPGTYVPPPTPKAPPMPEGMKKPPTKPEEVEEEETRPTEEDVAAAQVRAWDQATAARQYNPEGYIERIRAASMGALPEQLGSAGAPGEGPVFQIGERKPPPKMTPEDVRREGKTFMGGQQVRPTRKGVGAAAERNAGTPGAFTPSRQLPGLDVSWEHVQETESPAIQRMWLERKQKDLGLGLSEAQVRQEMSRATLLEEQAEEAALPIEDQIKRKTDRFVGMYDNIKERIMPNVNQAVSDRMALLATTEEGQKMQNDPAMKRAMEERLRRQVSDEAMTNLINMVAQIMMAQDPAGAARFLGSMASSGLYGMGMMGGTSPYSGTVQE